MRAGRLRSQITIQEKGQPYKDSYGAEVIPWVTYATVWASPEPVSGRENLDSVQPKAKISMRFRIRYCMGVTPEMQIVYDETIYNIISVLDVDGRHREQLLMCEAEL